MPAPILIAGLGSAVILYVLARTDQGATVIANVADSALGMLPRGIRNNNPGNIDWILAPASRWKGMIRRESPQEGGRFGVFDFPANGVRAIGKELLLDYSRGIRNVQGLIDNWAPPSENNTSAYVTYVAKRMAVSPTQAIDVRAFLPELVAAIIQHENGTQPYPMEDLRKWVYLS